MMRAVAPFTCKLEVVFHTMSNFILEKIVMLEVQIKTSGGLEGGHSTK